MPPSRYASADHNQRYLKGRNHLKTIKQTGKLFALAAILGIAAITGCSTWGKNKAAELIPPTVTSMFPADSARNVAINTFVIASFSEKMNAATIIGANFTVAADAVLVPGKVIYNDLNKTASFVPTNELARNVTYTATIKNGAADMVGNKMALDESWNFTTGQQQDTLKPTIMSTFPDNSASGVLPTSSISVTFSETMDPATVTEANMTVKAGGIPVKGTVSFDLPSKKAVFKPDTKLVGSAVHTAVITTGVTDVAGNAMAATFAWDFTPGLSLDRTTPTVISTYPSNTALNIGSNGTITATFSKAMNTATINAAHFTVLEGANQVEGIVTYDLSNKTAIFSPVKTLAFAAPHTVTITNGAKDLADNALMANKVWTFTTAPAGIGPSPVILGTAGNFVVLAKTAISTVAPSAITGNVGLSPAAKSNITGFSQTDTTGYATSTQVTGYILSADMAPPTTLNMITAVSDMEAAYADAAGRKLPNFINIAAGSLGGQVLAPGLYNWDTSVTVPTGITIAGGPNDVWIFQIKGDLITSSSVDIALTGGASAKNIFWQVGGRVTLGANSRFEGSILSLGAITLHEKAIMNGRALAQTDVALDQAVISKPAR